VDTKQFREGFPPPYHKSWSLLEDLAGIGFQPSPRLNVRQAKDHKTLCFQHQMPRFTIIAVTRLAKTSGWTRSNSPTPSRLSKTLFCKLRSLVLYYSNIPHKYGKLTVDTCATSSISSVELRPPPHMSCSRTNWRWRITSYTKITLYGGKDLYTKNILKSIPAPDPFLSRVLRFGSLASVAWLRTKSSYLSYVPWVLFVPFISSKHYITFCDTSTDVPRPQLQSSPTSIQCPVQHRLGFRLQLKVPMDIFSRHTARSLSRMISELPFYRLHSWLCYPS